MAGKLYLVGAGPGGPDLITRRAEQALRAADVVFVDEGVPQEIVRIAAPLTERIGTGPRPGRAELSCQEVIDLIARRVRGGQIVVHLVLGDPYMFGTGGREVLSLRGMGLDVEVVPGVTSLSAVPALAGIPVVLPAVSGSVLILHARGLKSASEEVAREEAVPRARKSAGDATRGGIVLHRHKPGAEGEAAERQASLRIRGDAASRVHIEMTDDQSQIEAVVPLSSSSMAHAVADPSPVLPFPLVDVSPDGWDAPRIDWQAACRAAETLVIMMPLEALDAIRGGLISGGRPPGEPVAAIEFGTTHRQRTVVATVGDFPEIFAEKRLRNPTLLVVGDVVMMRQHLNFFEERPLFGCRVVMGWQEPVEGTLANALRNAGGAVQNFVLTTNSPMAGLGDLLKEFQDDLRAASHIVFTTAASVEVFFTALRAAQVDSRMLPLSTHIVAMGEDVAAALDLRGLRCQVTGQLLLAENVPALFGRRSDKIRAVAIGPEAHCRQVAEVLSRARISLSTIPLYECRPSAVAVMELRLALSRGEVDAIIFQSPDAAQGCIDNWGTVTARRLLGEIITVCLGKATRTPLDCADVRVDIELPAEAAPGDVVNEVAAVRTRAAAEEKWEDDE